MTGPQQQAIIIRRKKKGGHAGHHGGAWKVAYADFVTAMMAFFLLLWLLNVTTSDQRKGLADYFAPAGIASMSSGSGGVMGGLTISSPGSLMADASAPAVEEETIPTVGRGQEGEEDVAGQSEAKEQAKTQVISATEEMKQAAEAMKREEERFQKAEEVLHKAIEESPELSRFADQLLVDRTAEGLRIQIIDRESYSMFPSGSAMLYERARDLIRLVGRVISRLPNQISVTGHTDSTPFSTGSRRDNWGLSTERANVSRGELVVGGVSESRIARVVGMAEREPLVPENPKDPKNRRISIVILRQTQEPGIPPRAGLTGMAPASVPTKATPPKKENR